MNPRPTGYRACWHAGGTIERRSGPISCLEALQLVVVHLELADVALAAGDGALAAYAVTAAAEILDAVSDALAWRNAAGRPGISSVARKLTQMVNARS